VKYILLLILTIPSTAICEKHYKVLVNDPSNTEKIIFVKETGKYYDQSRVLHDERKDGPMPQAKLDQESARLAAIKSAEQTKQSRRTELKNKLKAGTATLAEIQEYLGM